MGSRRERPLSVVGQRLPKVDAWAKVTGRDALRRRPRAAAHGVREAPPGPAPARPHPADRHDARRGPARRVRGHHGARLSAGPVRDHAREPGRGAALRREGALRRRPGGGRRRRGRGDGGGRRADDRRRVRAARLAHVDRGRPPGRHAPDPRVRGRAQHPQAGLPRVRRRRGGVPRGRSRARGRVLLRGKHASSDGAARGGRPVDAGRKAHALVLDPDAALRPPGARQGPRGSDEPHPGHRDPERRGLRREVRPLQPRDGGGAAGAAHGPARSRRRSRARRSSTPTGAAIRCSCGCGRGCGRTARSWRSTSGRGSMAGPTAPTASRRRSTRARSRPSPTGSPGTSSRGAASSRTSRPAARSAATARPSPGSPSRSTSTRSPRSSAWTRPTCGGAPSCPSTGRR